MATNLFPEVSPKKEASSVFTPSPAPEQKKQNLFDPVVTQQPTFWQKSLGYVEAVTEGALMGWDIWDEEKLPGMNQTALKVARIGGDVGGQIALAFVSGGLANLGLKGIKGATWLYELGTRSPALVQRVLGSSAVAKGVVGATTGAIVSGFQQLLAPPENKPGLQGAALNTLMFGAGEVGQELARQTLLKYYPKVSAGMEHFVGFMADNVTSVVAALPVVKDDENFVKEQFGSQMLAVSIYDTFLYALSKGVMKRSARIDDLMTKADDAITEAAKTGSAEAQQRAHEALNNVWEAAAPVDARTPEGVQAFVDKLDTMRQQEAINRKTGVSTSDMKAVLENATEVSRTGRAIPNKTAQNLLKLLEDTGQTKTLAQSMSNLGISKLKFEGSAGPIATFTDDKGRVVRLMDADVPYKGTIASPSFLQSQCYKLNDTVRIEVFEKVDTENISTADLEQVKQQLAKEGYEVPDLDADRVGRTADGRLVVFNVSQVKKVAPAIAPAKDAKPVAAEDTLARVKDVAKAEVAAVKELEEPPAKDTTENLFKDAEVVKDEDGLPHVKETEIKDAESVKDGESTKDVEGIKDAESIKDADSIKDAEMVRDGDEEKSKEEEATKDQEAIKDAEYPATFRFRDDPRIGQIQRSRDLAQRYDKNLSPEEHEALQKNVKPPNYAINTVRYDDPDEVRAIILDVAEALHSPKEVTFDDIKAAARNGLNIDKANASNLAEQFGTPLEQGEKLVSMIATMPEQMTKFRMLIAATAEQIDGLKSRILSGEASELEMAQFLYHQGMLSKLTTLDDQISENVARTLSARRIVVNGKYADLLSLNPTDMASPDASAKVESVIKAAGGVEGVRKLAEEVAAADTLEKKAAVARKADKKAGFIDALVEVMQSSILTSPATHITNTVSQAFNTLNQSLTEVVASGYGSFRSLFTGGDYMTATEVAARIQGDIAGMLGALVNPVVKVRDLDNVQHIVRGFGPLEGLLNVLSGKADETLKMIQSTSLSTRASAENKGNSMFNEYIESLPMADWVKVAIEKGASYQQLFSFGALELGDKPFAWGGWQREVNGQIIQRAKAAGIEATEMDAFAKEVNDQVRLYRKAEMLKGQTAGEEAVKQLSQLPPERLQMIKEIDEAAVAFSNEMTWKDPINSKILAQIEGVMRNNPAMRLFVPFYHTPVKILEKALQYSGLSRSLWEDLRAGGRRTDLAMAKLTIGTALYGLGAYLVTEGLITPRAKDEQERKQMLEAGRPELSINIGGRWYDYSKMDPAPAWFLQTAADFARILHNPEVTDDGVDAIAGSFIAALGKNAIDQSFLKSVNDIVEAIETGRGDRIVSNLVEPLVPFSGLLKQAPNYKLGGLNPLYDPTMNEVTSLIERFTPKLDALDQFGKAIPGWFNTAGLRYRPQSDSPIRKELGELGMSLPEQTNFLYGQQITPEKRQEIMKTMDEDFHVEDVLNKLVEKPGWKKLDPDLRRQTIERIYSSFKKAAQLKALQGDPLQKEVLVQSVVEKALKMVDNVDSKNNWAPWFTND